MQLGVDVKIMGIEKKIAMELLPNKNAVRVTPPFRPPPNPLNPKP